MSTCWLYSLTGEAAVVSVVAIPAPVPALIRARIAGATTITTTAAGPGAMTEGKVQLGWEDRDGSRGSSQGRWLLQLWSQCRLRVRDGPTDSEPVLRPEPELQ